jgi:hypothetical protein
MKITVYEGCKKQGIPANLEHIIDAVVEKMRARNPICCLFVEINDNEIVASTCGEYIREKVRFSFQSKNGKVDLIQLPPANLEEEIQQAVTAVSSAAYDPRVSEKFLDEERGVAVFILVEIIDRGPLGFSTARGHQERYSLYRLRRGQKPKLLFSDTAWTGTPECHGRQCSLVGLKVNDGQIRIAHDTSETFSDNFKQEELVFDLN